jgi:hypothetical protein
LQTGQSVGHQSPFSFQHASGPAKNRARNKDANKELIYCVACRKTRQRSLLSGDGIQPNTPGQESWQYGASQSD